MPWYPSVLAAAYVLNLWVASGVSVLAMTRSLVVVVAGTTALVVVLTIVTRRPAIAGAMSMALFAVLASRLLGQFVAVVFIVLAVGVVLAVWSRIRRWPLPGDRLTDGLNAFSAIFLLLVLAGAASGGELAAIPQDLAQGRGDMADAGNGTGERTGSGPDILILMLDGYPRTDSLARLFGGDSREFTEGLEERGFAISESSQSNYPYTQATLTSMLHMKPLDEIDELRQLIDGAGADNFLLRLTLNRNPAFDVLREHGYTVIASSPGYEHVTLRQADVFLDDGSLNEFEEVLLQGTPIQLITSVLAPDAFLDQHRNRILASFEYLEELATERERPVFALVHVPSPHLPVVIARDGGVAASPPGVNAYRAEPLAERSRAAYLDQVHFLSVQTLESLDYLLARPSQRGRVIVVMSDHGAAVPPLPGEPWTAEHHANFFAIQGAETLGVEFPTDTTPVNLLPTLFNAALGTDLPIWPDERFIWNDTDLRFTEE
jgi:hypothetical protein